MCASYLIMPLISMTLNDAAHCLMRSSATGTHRCVPQFVYTLGISDSCVCQNEVYRMNTHVLGEVAEVLLGPTWQSLRHTQEHLRWLLLTFKFLTV